MNITKLLGNAIPSWVKGLAVALPLLAGCASTDGPDVDEEDESIAEAQQKELSANELSRNALSENELSANELSANELSANELSANELSANAMSVKGYGLELMKYMIRCALPDSVCMDFQATASDTNIPAECVDGACHFCGNLNLAPNWLTGGLSLNDEKWVSACLLAHVNLNHVSIPISVRDAVAGRLSAAHAPETNDYSASEASFYGNIFRRGPSGQFEKYVCNAGATTAPTGRVCGLNDQDAVDCGMTFMGSCAGGPISLGGPFDPTVAACSYVESSANGAVRQCLSAQGTQWEQVITIYDHEVCGNGICSGHENPGNCPDDCKLKHKSH